MDHGAKAERGLGIAVFFVLLGWEQRASTIIFTPKICCLMLFLFFFGIRLRVQVLSHGTSRSFGPSGSSGYSIERNPTLTSLFLL